MTTSARDPFRTTRWTWVNEVVQSDPAAAREALAKLCEIYWLPIYACIRKSGHSSHDAKDLTQNFFQQVIEKDFFAAAEKTKGRLRGFLKMHLKHFLQDEYKSRVAQKRGGGLVVLMSPEMMEQRFLADDRCESSPEYFFQRRWALSVLENALRRLQEDAGEGPGLRAFYLLRPLLVMDEPARPYSVIAAELSISEDTLRVRVARLRGRFAEFLRDEVAQTLKNPTEEQIEAELRELREFL